MTYLINILGCWDLIAPVGLPWWLYKQHHLYPVHRLGPEVVFFCHPTTNHTEIYTEQLHLHLSRFMSGYNYVGLYQTQEFKICLKNNLLHHFDCFCWYAMHLKHLFLQTPFQPGFAASTNQKEKLPLIAAVFQHQNIHLMIKNTFTCCIQGYFHPCFPLNRTLNYRTRHCPFCLGVPYDLAWIPACGILWGTVKCLTS